MFEGLDEWLKESISMRDNQYNNQYECVIVMKTMPNCTCFTSRVFHTCTVLIITIIFFNLPPTSSHLYPVQVGNCDSNSRLVMDKDENGKFRPERVTTMEIVPAPSPMCSTPAPPPPGITSISSALVPPPSMPTPPPPPSVSGRGTTSSGGTTTTTGGFSVTEPSGGIVTTGFTGPFVGVITL